MNKVRETVFFIRVFFFSYTTGELGTPYNLLPCAHKGVQFAKTSILKLEGTI